MPKLNGYKVARNADLRNSKYGSSLSASSTTSSVTAAADLNSGATSETEATDAELAEVTPLRRPDSDETEWPHGGLKLCRSVSEVSSGSGGPKVDLRRFSERYEGPVFSSADTSEREHLRRMSQVNQSYTSGPDSSDDENDQSSSTTTTNNNFHSIIGPDRTWTESEGDAFSTANMSLSYPSSPVQRPRADLGPAEVSPTSSTSSSSAWPIWSDQDQLFRKLIDQASLVATVREPLLSTEYSPATVAVATIEDQTDGGVSEGPTTTTVDNNNGTCGSASGTNKSHSLYSLPGSAAADLNIPWLDHSLLDQGRSFVRRNFVAVMFAHLIGLLFLLSVKPISAMLLRYGRFHKRGKRHHWHQYVLMFRRLKHWYEFKNNSVDITDPEHPVTSDLLQLRRGMCNAGKNFRKYLPPPAQELELTSMEESLLFAVRGDMKANSQDLKHTPKILTTIKPDVPWSQYDLAIVQFAFFGLIATCPRIFGIYGDKKGLQGFIHMWAVYGHILGLQSQYNLASPENFDEKTNERILQHVFVFSFRNADAAMLRMSTLLCEGVKWWTICMSRLKLLLLFMAKSVAKSENTKEIAAHLRWFEKLEYWFYSSVWLRWVCRIFFLRILANLMARFVLVAAQGTFFAQVKWRMWRAKRKPRQVVLYPHGILNEGMAKA